jgi:predicted O-linked N-acetylglucosamine transferase (SPINDLY family)
MTPHPGLTAAFGLLQRGDVQGAHAALSQVLTAEPRNATAHLYQGHALYRLNRKTEALQHFERAATLQPAFADAFYNKGVLRAELGDADAAEASFKRTLALKPDYVAVYGNLGALLLRQGRADEAAAAFGTLIRHQPNDARGYFNRGMALVKAGHDAEARADFEKAVALNPNYAPAHAALMTAFAQCRQFAQALPHADRAAALMHTEPAIHISRGDVLRALGRFDDAVKSYDKAITLKPDMGPAFVVRGDAYTNLKQYDRAAADYVQGAKLQPFEHFAVGYAVQACAQICDWATIDSLMPVLRDGVRQGAAASTPFSLLACEVSAQEQLQCARMMAMRVMEDVTVPLPPPRHSDGGKIRIGYFSPDFGAHAVSYLMAGVFGAHDRTRVEVVAFSYGPPATDDFSRRIKSSFDQFIDVRSVSDRDVAGLAQSLNIDIAVDLAGFTGRGRPGIFAHRASPVQVNYLGFAGTMGAPFTDYIIVDDVIAPEGSEVEFVEKLVRLPGSFLPSDPKRPRERAAKREDFGLREDQFVFCAFNNSYKINRATFESWLSILARVDNGALWLTASNPWQVENLKRAAAERGCAADRLIFAEPLPSYAQHLSRYALADLFLDALPYNAHTTASDALWLGLPVLTCVGDTFAGRVAASVLTALEMPDLITRSRADFENLAVALAQDAGRLAGLRQRIAENRDKTLLFDTPRFTRDLEQAFAMMVERSRADHPPDHILVHPKHKNGRPTL